MVIKLGGFHPGESINPSHCIYNAFMNPGILPPHGDAARQKQAVERLYHLLPMVGIFNGTTACWIMTNCLPELTTADNNRAKGFALNP